MNVSYDYYRIFYYAAKCGSFSKAAEALQNNQPNITRAINRLEQQTGCRLFSRTKHGVSLTPEGERLFYHVEAAVMRIMEGETELESHAGLKNGSVSIGVSDTALNIFLIEKLEKFRRMYPGVKLRILNRSTTRAILELESGTADIAVVTTPFKLKGNMRAVELTSFDDILICGKAYAHLADKKMRLEDIDNYPLISLEKDTMTHAFYNQIFMQHKMIFQPDTEVATTDKILPLIKHNLGIGFIPAPFTVDALKRGEVFKIELVQKMPKRQICLINDRSRLLSAAARELKKLICDKNSFSA